MINWNFNDISVSVGKEKFKFITVDEYYLFNINNMFFYYLNSKRHVSQTTFYIPEKYAEKYSFLRSYEYIGCGAIYRRYEKVLEAKKAREYFCISNFCVT